jgi:hypothetical protein
MAYGTVNADIIQSSVSGVSLGAGNASIMKNRIINGAMVISQYNGTSAVTPASTYAYVIDRFVINQSQVSKLTAQQLSASPPTGFQNYLGITVAATATVGASDYFAFAQAIEGYNMADFAWGTANAKTVTLSAWVYSNTTGTFGGALRDNSGSRSYPFTYSIPVANTWTQISVTIPGDTSGSVWNQTNGVGVYIFFGVGAGATYSGTAGSWVAGNLRSATGGVSLMGSTSNYLYATGVQLEVGSSATGFEYRQYQQELALCQRYYEVIQPGQATAGNASSTVAFLNGSFVVTKRAAPTMGGGSGIQVRMYASSGGAGSYTGGGIAATNYVNTGGYEVQVGGFSGLSNVFGVFQSATTNFTASAEL